MKVKWIALVSVFFVFINSAWSKLKRGILMLSTNKNTRNSFLDLISWHLPQSWHQSLLSTSLYDKRDDFNFTIINCSHFGSSILTASMYGFYISTPYWDTCLSLVYIWRQLVHDNYLLVQSLLIFHYCVLYIEN
jgi:hypothetical protein